MLQRRVALEVGVQHPMREHHVRLPARHMPPRRDPTKIPKPVDDDPVEPSEILLQPAAQLRRVGKGRSHRTQRVNREVQVLKKRRCGIIHRHRLALVAERTKAHQRAHTLCRAAGGRVNSADDMQDAHRAD